MDSCLMEEAENGELWSVVDRFDTHPPPPIQLVTCVGSLVAADNGFWFEDCFEEIPTEETADRLPSPRRVEYPDHDDASLRASRLSPIFIISTKAVTAPVA